MKVFAKVLSVLLCTTLLFQSSLTGNILAVTTLASPSHHLWHRPLFLEVIKKGHNLTVLGHDTETIQSVNFTMITLEGVYDKIHKDFVLEDLVYNGPLKSLKMLWDWDELVCAYDLQTEGLKTLLNYPKDYKFDLIIWDLNGGRCLYPLIDRFGNPPIIATSPFGLQPFMSYIFGKHLHSYIPYYQTSSTDKMHYFERFKNFVYIHVMNLSRRYYLIPREHELALRFFGNNIRPIDDVERNFSLLLVNTDPIMNFVESLPPNIIPVAGIHIKPPKELPKDLKRILDSAERGVVLVVFGTNLNWNNFEAKQKQAFFDAFLKLPQIILMKSPKTDVILPKNVIIREWLPQNDILAHRNVKLFITHGGALSTQEAMYHGIPIVGMPFFLDQHGNMGKIQARELGKTINYVEATSDTVYDTISEVLNNPRYRNNMETLSKRYRDQPQTPMERAVYWTEYVLRHGSVEHLSEATRDMVIFQRFDMDIAAVFSGIFVILLFTIYKSFKQLCSILLRLRHNTKSVTKHKQH